MISSIECSSGILAACMPTWRPLFKFLGHGITSFLSSNNKSRNASSNDMGFGNTTTGRKSRARSRSRVRVASLRMEHDGMGTGMLGSKRSENSLSGSSVEEMLKAAEIELSDRDSKSSTSLSPYEIARSNSSTSPARSRSPPPSKKGEAVAKREEYW